jgi:hypothetical protein
MWISMGIFSDLYIMRWWKALRWVAVQECFWHAKMLHSWPDKTVSQIDVAHCLSGLLSLLLCTLYKLCKKGLYIGMMIYFSPSANTSQGLLDGFWSNLIWNSFHWRPTQNCALNLLENAINLGFRDQKIWNTSNLSQLTRLKIQCWYI